MKSITSNSYILVCVFIITYPLFYFTYKYLDPYIVSHDLDHYLNMYRSLDLKNTETPFNTRLISSFLVYLISKLNIYYTTEMVFHSSVISPNIYFSAFFVSYLCFIFTIFIVFKLFYKLSENLIISAVFAFVYVLSFGNFLYSLNPLTDSCGYLLGAIAIYLYIYRSKWIWPVLVLAIIQREYLLLGFGLISLFDYFIKNENKRYHLYTFLVCLFSFGTYVILRKVFLYTPKYDNQLNISEFLDRLLNNGTNWTAFIYQTFFIQNTLILYFGLLFYKKIKRLPFDLKDFFMIILLLIQIVFFCLAGNLGNNGGRYFHLFTPLLVYFIYKEFMPLLNKETFTKTKN